MTTKIEEFKELVKGLSDKELKNQYIQLTEMKMAIQSEIAIRNEKRRGMI